MPLKFKIRDWIAEVDEDDGGDYEHTLDLVYQKKAHVWTEEGISDDREYPYRNHRDLNGLFRMIDDIMNALMIKYGEPPRGHRNEIREKILYESLNNCAKSAKDHSSYEEEARRLKRRLEEVLRAYPKDSSSGSHDYQPWSHLAKSYWDRPRSSLPPEDDGTFQIQGPGQGARQHGHITSRSHDHPQSASYPTRNSDQDPPP